MGIRAGWNDNNYEGKALRRVFTKLMKRFEKLEKDPDTDEEKLQKMAHTISMIAKAKGELAKEHNDLARKIKELEARLPKEIPVGTVIVGAEEHARELPPVS